jgi:hypothetical protein
MKSLKILILLFILYSSPNYLFAGKVSIEEMKMDLSKINGNGLGLIIWDQRPMVVDHSQKESFLGYRRSITGIAFPYFIKSDQHFSMLLSNKIVEGFNSQNDQISIIEASPFDKEDQVVEKIENSKQDKILLLKLNKLYFDGVAKIEYVVDIQLQLFSSKGEIIFEKELIEEIPMGSSLKYKKTVPITLKKIIEDLLNSADVLEAINSSSINTNENKTSGNFDIIVTKKGKEIKSNITEIGLKNVKYKLHSNLEGPIRVISISDVFMIKYKNGDKEVFDKQE